MKNHKKIIIWTFLFFQIFCPVFAQEEDFFNLSGVIENIINYQNKEGFVSDIRNDAKENYSYAMQNFYSGNAVVAYSEFLKTIDALDKNISLLMFSKRLYEIGFFSLGDSAISKISGKEKMEEQIDKLKETYSTNYKLSKEEESYLAKAYTLIYYNNSPEEVAFNLIKKNILLENSDYANFIMAQSMFECKQFNQALIYIDKAIEKNDINSNYKLFKAKILVQVKKYKEALKYIEANENNMSVYLANDFKILKQKALFNLSSNEEDKKFYQIYSLYLAGNYYKVLKETQNILTFSKANPKILTLQGMAHLALGEYDPAKEDFENSYKQNKNFKLTQMGLADCLFIEKKYKDAYTNYKKLFNSELKKEAIIKASIALDIMNNDLKKQQKTAKLAENFEKDAFYEYYTAANNLFIDDLTNKKKYAAKSLGINILNPNTWDILLEEDYKNKNFEGINKIVFMLSFSNSLDAEYYYYSALSLNSQNNKKEAFYELKKAVNINPDYKPAIDFMNKLQSELI